MGTPLAGKRLGVLGLGHLGKEVARMGLGLQDGRGCVEPEPHRRSGRVARLQMVEQSGAFATSDVVSLNLVLSDRTRGIVGSEELSAMKQGAILVNAARAGLVDHRRVDGRVTVTGELRQASTSPTGATRGRPRLRKMPNVVLTPHSGMSSTMCSGTTTETSSRTSKPIWRDSLYGR